VSGGPQVVFHDLIHSDETLSLVVAPVTPANDVESLADAKAVGERLSSTVIAPTGSNRSAELVHSRERVVEGRTFYDLEYVVQLPDRQRHELATVVADKGRLYTLSTSTNSLRWDKVQALFEQVIGSLTLTS
jgi:photosystem II oxygen-evolving enhancer protein 2